VTASAESTAATNAEKVFDLPNTLEALIKGGLINRDDSDQVLATPRPREFAHQHPLEHIARVELTDRRNPDQTLDLDTLTHWLAEHSGQPYFRIDPLKVDVTSITEVMSYAFAQNHNILAVEVNPNEVVIASSQPFVAKWEDDIRHVVRKDITRVVTSPADLHRYMVEFYTLSRSVSKAKGDGSGQALTGVTNMEQLLQLGDQKAPDANDEHIVNIVDWLLQYAFAQRASDIHLEPRREQTNVRFRIDGVMHSVYELPAQVGAAVTSRLKTLGRLNVAEKRRPQDGRLKTKSPEGVEIELRLSTMPTAFGEKMVMRIFDPDVLLKNFAELGLADKDASRWHGMIKKPNGIVLVTGPTGSGKTTTLYSTLKQLATSDVNVCTVEDPIEMVEASFNQMQVQHNIDLTFASGVRTLLRQDPDIIMVGEIRDLETAEMAIQAALTGHLVLSTLHTNDAPTAITRLLELGVPGYLIRSTINGVMAQRLVRTLCPHCKEENELDEKAWRQLVMPWKAEMPKQAFGPKGCLECRNTGFLGRMGIYEIMPMSESLAELVAEGVSIDDIRKQAMKENMRTLRLSGAQKVANGLTTITEVMRVAPESRFKH